MKVNVDENGTSASRLNVRAIPNLVLLAGGRVAEQILGAVPRARLVQAIERVLKA